MSLDPHTLRGEAPKPAAPTRPLYWAVRRELWEHRYIYLAPAAIAAFVVFAHLMSAIFISDTQRTATLTDPAKSHEFMDLYGAATFMILLSSWLVGAIYSLSALQGERRDRSILFWKSLPVSDRTTVLAKAAIPIALLPAFVFVLIIAANVAMLVLQSVAWQLDGFDPRGLWARLDLPFMWLCLLYGLPFLALWHAPIYAWMLMVSAWARRVPFLWAIAPIVALLIFERLAMGRTASLGLVSRRLIGGVREAFTVGGGGKVWIERAADLEPLRIYTHPGLWVGVGVAALFLFLAIRLRRSRGPL